MHLFGHASDLERAELLYTSLLLQSATALARTRSRPASTPPPSDGPGWPASGWRSATGSSRPRPGRRVRPRPGSPTRAAPPASCSPTGPPSSSRRCRPPTLVSRPPDRARCRAPASLRGGRQGSALTSEGDRSGGHEGPPPQQVTGFRRLLGATTRRPWGSLRRQRTSVSTRPRQRSARTTGRPGCGTSSSPRCPRSGNPPGQRGRPRADAGAGVLAGRADLGLLEDIGVDTLDLDDGLVGRVSSTGASSTGAGGGGSLLAVFGADGL